MRPIPLPAVLLCALLATGCALKTVEVTEKNFLPDRKAPLLSDEIRRSNLAIALPEGGTLRGWRLQHPAPKARLVYFYGNGDHLWRNAQHLHQLAQSLELELICFDYRGSGASDGEKRFLTLRADALRIHDSLPRDGLPLLVMGYSLGSVPAIHLAAQRPVAGLAVLAGISSFEDVLPALSQGMPWYAKPFVELKFDPVFSQRPQPKEELAKVKAPTFILHGDADLQLPVLSGDELAKASPAQWKRYLRPVGQGHGNLPLFAGEGQAALRDWVAEAAKSAAR